MKTQLTRVIASTTLAAAVIATGASAQAASDPVSGAEVPVHFDLKAGQMPENIVTDRNGSVDVSFAGNRQVARITHDGKIQPLATIPAPADKKAASPLLGFPAITGLVREGKTFYVAYSAGSSETGIWTFTEGGKPKQLASLPSNGLPNGLAMNRKTGNLYVTDSVNGTVRTIATRGKESGQVTLFSGSKALASTGFFGANGVKVHDGNLYVSNLDKGTVLKAPLKGSRTGRFTTVAKNLEGIDDFSFTGKGDQFLAALITKNKVVLINDAGKHRTVLTQKDGLSNPTAVAVRGTTIYVPSAAYTTQKDPNLLTATLGSR